MHIKVTEIDFHKRNFTKKLLKTLTFKHLKHNLLGLCSFVYYIICFQVKSNVMVTLYYLLGIDYLHTCGEHHRCFFGTDIPSRRYFFNVLNLWMVFIHSMVWHAHMNCRFNNSCCKNSAWWYMRYIKPQLDTETIGMIIPLWKHL